MSQRPFVKHDPHTVTSPLLIASLFLKVKIPLFLKVKIPTDENGSTSHVNLVNTEYIIRIASLPLIIYLQLQPLLHTKS